ncbi:unnamed protein product, partial [Prorocentrum cordatum]
MVEALVRELPDPRLHEVLMELLWRGLRRAGGTDAAAAPGLVALESELGAPVIARLRGLSAEDLLEWGAELALEINRHRNTVVELRPCRLGWGSLETSEASARLSAHGLELACAGAAEGGAVVEFEVPWDFVSTAAPAVLAGPPFFFYCDVERLVAVGALPEAIVHGSWVPTPDALLEIKCDASPELFRPLCAALAGRPGGAALEAHAEATGSAGAAGGAAGAPRR